MAGTRIHPIHLHEIVRTLPGQEEPYMESVASIRNLPGREGWQGNFGEFGQFRSVDGAGAAPVVINLWEHDWTSQAEALARQFEDRNRDVAMEDWWNRNLHLRTGGYDRLLVPADYSPDAAALAARDGRGVVFLQEIVWLPWGGVEAWLDDFGRRFLPAAEAHGAHLVGAWRVAMRPTQALTILGFKAWESLAAFAADLDASTARAEGVRRSEPLVMVPGRRTPLAP